jgi:hypothetical protein
VAGLHVRPTTGRLEDNINNAKDLRGEQFVTGQHIGSGRRALDTIAMGVYLVADLVVEAGSNNNLVNITAHSAKKGDVFRINTSANGIEEFEVTVDEIVSPNSFRLGAVLSAALSVGDTVSVLRPITPRMSASGTTLATLSASPTQFKRNGVSVDVTEDTVTPANNLPLPVKLVDLGGDLTITAQNLNVQLSDTGANPDVVRIGNGTNQLGINASNEALTHDANALTALNSLITLITATNGYVDGLEGLATTLNGKDFATQTTLASVLAGMSTAAKQDLAKAVLDTIATNTGNGATSAKQDVSKAVLDNILAAITATNGYVDGLEGLATTLNGKDFATQTTLAAQKVVIDSLLAAHGVIGDAAVTNPASNATSIAALKGILSLITSLNSKIDTLNTATSPAFDSVGAGISTSGTISKPAGATKMVVQNTARSNSGIRFTKTAGGASSTVGFLLEAGQSTPMVGAASIDYFALDGAAADVQVLWMV